MIYYVNNEKPIYGEELINEQLVYGERIKKKVAYCIFSDAQSGRNFEYDPYIKVYNAMNQNDATEVIRVSMKTGSPLPTEHKNSGKDKGKKRLKFTKEVAEFLQNAMLKYPNLYNDYPDYIKTVYDGIYFDIIRVCGSCIKYPIPNFMENIEK